MSTLNTLSKFFYGTQVTNLSRSLDFNEGGPEIQATLKVGTYTLTEYAAEIQRALRAIGTQNYLVTINRSTRKLTISAPLVFSLLAGTGSRIGSGIWATAGATATNKTGLNTYTLENGAGSEYVPQYYLFEYISKEHSIILEDGTASSTPSGYSQVASFGDGARIKMNIKLITNKLGLKNVGFVENASGVNDFMNFIKYLVKKGRTEFMPDKNTPNNFIKCHLESTANDRDARRFELKNMAVDVYESDNLTFREVLI